MVKDVTAQHSHAGSAFILSPSPASRQPCCRDRPVAIKVILPSISGEPGFEERFRREARLVVSLRHPHIVQVFDFDVADGKPFMVMEYSLIHYALGQIDYSQERLFAAGGEFEQALAAFPANVDAQAGLGDLALRGGDATQALALYDAALADVPQYFAGLPAENASLTGVLLQVRRSLALAQQGDATATVAALDQALALAEAVVALTPRSPLAQFALATAHLARGETTEAEAAFARAGECDQSLVAARGRLESGLANLQTGD